MSNRIGFTTGTCAQAAAKASARMLITGCPVKKVDVETPSGIKFSLKVVDQEIGENFARCGIVKDSGSDPDVTNGIKVCAEVRFSTKPGISITGGKGVGRVTKPGLPVRVGEYAINPVPREMIVRELTPYLDSGRGIEVIISVPGGEEIARRTFNPRIGIVGGISIIGTSGVVEPRSINAYRASLSLQLDVLKAKGIGKAVLVLGYVGERFCREVLKAEPDSVIRIGDNIGFMLEECIKKGIRDVLLIGYIGKLVKIANAQFNTHIRFGDSRISTIAHYAKLCGAGEKIIRDILEQTSAQAAVDILRYNGFTSVFDRIAEKIIEKIYEFTCGQIRVDCILLSLEGEVLAEYRGD